MTILLAFLTCSIVFTVMVILILPRPTEEERRLEDEEFFAQYAKRKGGTR